MLDIRSMSHQQPTDVHRRGGRVRTGSGTSGIEVTLRRSRDLYGPVPGSYDEAIVTTAAVATQRWKLDVVTDGRRLFAFQIPAVAFHPAAMAALDIPELSVVTIKHLATGQTLAAWAVSDSALGWEGCPTPWSTTVRLSLAAWRQLLPDTEARTGDHLEITVLSQRLPVRPSHIERLLGGNEVGLHRDDAQKLGVKKWALVNHNEIPTVCRVRLSEEDRDRGCARLSYQTRMLLGIRDSDLGDPEIAVSPIPTARWRRRLMVAEPQWATPRGRKALRWRLARAAQSHWERAVAIILGAPQLAFRTLEAAPGEDQALTIRVPGELFPLLGTEPGKQVYVEWGPHNRTIATALVAYEPEAGDWPSIQMIGRRPQHVPGVPTLAKVNIGAPTRAALGIPRVTVVTVRRRIWPLIVSKLNELIIPATGVSIGLAADINLRAWELIAAMFVVLVLLLAPLRTRRSPRGRVP
jgi:hypothetical protein